MAAGYRGSGDILLFFYLLKTALPFGSAGWYGLTLCEKQPYNAFAGPPGGSRTASDGKGLLPADADAFIGQPVSAVLEISMHVRTYIYQGCQTLLEFSPKLLAC